MTEQIASSEVIELYKDMRQLTWAACQEQNCKYFSCCNSIQCCDTAEYALQRYGVDLDYRPGETFVVEGIGCRVPPYLRPLCTVHQCRADWAGEDYWSLRSEIDRLEIKEGALGVLK